MPKFVKMRILTDFLFPDFLERFNWAFKIPKESPGIQYCFWNMDDELYCNFMSHIMMSLEPRVENAHHLIVEENGEWQEVVFFNKGTFMVGYELNRIQHFVLTFNSVSRCHTIGAYGCMTNRRALFVFKTHTRCEGFIIRKSNWISIC